MISTSHSALPSARRSLAKASLLLILLGLGLLHGSGATRGFTCSSKDYSKGPIAFRMTACIWSSIITAPMWQGIIVTLENTGGSAFNITYEPPWPFFVYIYDRSGLLVTSIDVVLIASEFVQIVKLNPGDSINGTLGWDTLRPKLNTSGVYYAEPYFQGLIQAGNTIIRDSETGGLRVQYMLVDGELLPFDVYQELTLALLGFIAVLLVVLLYMLNKRLKPHPEQNPPPQKEEETTLKWEDTSPDDKQHN